MNRRQKEVLERKLQDEKKLLRELGQVYRQGIRDCSQRIRELSMRTDLENLQSIVYQKKYQEAIKKQLEQALEELNRGAYATTKDFIKKAYQTGFFGTLYDLQGQGIPLLFPIHPEEMVKALEIDSKISGGLYRRMGEDVRHLKTSIRAEVSRGIATGRSWNQIAEKIAVGMKTPFQKALNHTARIARTEGHRVGEAAALDCQRRAKGKGADIKKQWCSTLDRRTRPGHVHADGQVREIEEAFEVDGEKLLYPGDPSGSPGNVINCRCTLLQRASWMLETQESYTKWDGDRGELVTLPAKSYDEFRKKAEEKLDGKKLELSDFPVAFSGKGEAKATQALLDYVNGCEGADPKVLRLYKNLGKLDPETAKKLTISHAEDHSLQPITGPRGDLRGLKLTIPKMTGDNLAGQANTTLHEIMHLIDVLAGKGGVLHSTTRPGLRDIFSNKTTERSEAIKKLFADHAVELRKAEQAVYEAYEAKVVKLLEKYLPNGGTAYEMSPADHKACLKEIKKLKSQLDPDIDYAQRNVMGGGVGCLEDIYDALSHGILQGYGVLYGHGAEYYSMVNNRIAEATANYAALSVTRPDLVKLLAEDKPDLVRELDGLVDAMLREVEK